jgi:hypothetical protein
MAARSDAPDLADAAVVDRDIGYAPLGTGAVDDGGTTDDGLVGIHVWLL